MSTLKSFKPLNRHEPVAQVKWAGVVGAGGGDFPAHVKLASKADTIIANGAECEPLLHKDAVLMEEEAVELVRGMLLAKEAVGARDAVIGIKAKKKRAVETVEQACQGTAVRVHLLGDYYPAGDEYDLVYEVTQRLIPPAGIPLQVGAVVNNIETFINIAAAAENRPVTHKMLTRSRRGGQSGQCNSSGSSSGDGAWRESVLHAYGRRRIGANCRRGRTESDRGCGSIGQRRSDLETPPRCLSRSRLKPGISTGS